MRTSNLVRLAVACAAALGSVSAFATTVPSVFGVADFADLKYSSSTGATVTSTNKSKMGLGGGAGIEFHGGGKMGVEVDAIYLGRKLDTALATGATFHYLQFPVIARYWLSKGFSVGVGGYYAMAMGDIKDSTGATATYAATFTKKSDYGAVGVIGFNLPIGSRAALLLEGRYNLGLANTNDNPGTSATISQKWTDMQGLVGLRFGMAK
jgi:hypothetical protein